MKMKDRNSFIITALAIAITAGNIAIPLAMPGTERAHIQMASNAAPDRHAPAKAGVCALALTEKLAN